MNIKDFPQGACQGTGFMIRNAIDSKTTMVKTFHVQIKVTQDNWYTLLG